MIFLLMHFHNSSYVIPLYYKETENAPLRGVLAEFVIIFVWMHNSGKLKSYRFTTALFIPLL